MENENIVETNENEITETSATTEQPQCLALPIKFNMDVNLGINLSIIITLVIFAGLLFLPAKMLLDTSYDIPSDNDVVMKTSDTMNFINSMKFRERKLCPGLDYEYWLTSIYFSNYDRNCTYTRKREKRIDEISIVVENREKSVCTSEKKKVPIVQNYNRTIEEIRATRPKSVPVTGHILGMMLVVSAIAAFVEVLRIRFTPKDTPTVETASSRKGSTIELMPTRRFYSRDTMRYQRSFELQGMQRSSLRLGPLPPPLIRRSSFPTYIVNAMDQSTTIPDTSASRSMSRRPSTINSEHTNVDSAMSNLHRRAHLIRRH